MEELDIERFETLPLDSRRDILSAISDPDEITRLSTKSEYLKRLLFDSVTQLKTNKMTYLHINWLLNFSFLQEVDDNIVFRITRPLDSNFKIPLNLRKINFLIIFNDSSSVNTALHMILETLVHNHHTRLQQLYFEASSLREYTIRIKLKYGTNQIAIVIDNGCLTIFTYTENANMVEITYKNLILDFDNNLKPYYMSYQLDSIEYNDSFSNSRFINTAIHPNASFKSFLTDILAELNINIVDIFKGYLLTGYMMKRIINRVMFEYIRKSIRDFNNYTDVGKLKIAQYIDISLISLQHPKFIDIYEVIEKKFNLDNRKLDDAVIFHIYLIEPSIFQLILDDSDRMSYQY